MGSGARRLLASFGFAWLATASLPASAQVEALLDFTGTAAGPFPTNVFTKVDLTNRSNRVVSLPRPDCTVMPARCVELDALNSLDGFNLQPRLRIPFSGAIDVSTVSSASFFLVNLGNTDAARDRHRGEIIGVNQVVFDPETNTLTGESDALLHQHSRYALIATQGIKDTTGRAVRGTALARFLRNRRAARDAGLAGYRAQVLLALAKLRAFGITEDRVVSASIFTTQSNTAILEKMRAEQQGIAAPAASFATGMSGERAVFLLPAVQSVTFQRQVGTAPTFANSTVQIAAFGLIPNSVGAIAFGTYPSPTFLNSGRVIPAVGTRTGRPAIQGTNAVSFFLVLPAGPRPAAGWPVALFGHGFGGEKNSIIGVASVLASQGIATAAINVVGHGGGPAGTMTITRTDGTQVVVASGGRGQDLNADGNIDGTEGFSAGGLFGSRDPLRQTVADLMQLIRTFRSGGVDADGDGAGDFDPNRVFYTGISLGGIYGTMLLGVEPNLRAGVPNVPGGVLTEIARLSQAFRASFVAGFGASGLLNAPPVAAPLFGFNENIPLRDLPPLLNTVPGAGRVAEAFDNLEWVAVAGDPLGYARHIRAEPLAGNGPKPLIFQFARGDMTVPNPTAAALVRAGEFQDRVTFFRNDIFVQQQQAAGASAAALNGLRNPHGFLGSIVGARAQSAIAAQMQIGMFFASNGTLTIDPDGPGPLFETPIVTLPEDLGFLPVFQTMTMSTPTVQ